MFLTGKVALVTGSTQGIGLTVAEHLSKQGCSVVLSGSRSEEAASHTVAQVKQLSSAAVHYLMCDLRQTKDIEELCNKIVERYPDGIDILVNNAGVVYKASVTEMLLEDWNQQMDINLTAPFLLAKHFIPYMKKKKWGRIINISSLLAMVAQQNVSAYISSKHGLVGLTKAIALETAEFGITCNSVNAGTTNAPMLHGIIKKMEEDLGILPEELLERFRSLIPSKKLLTTKEIAEYVMFLCSPGADNMTGTAVPIDGGYTAQVKDFMAEGGERLKYEVHLTKPGLTSDDFERLVKLKLQSVLKGK